MAALRGIPARSMLRTAERRRSMEQQTGNARSRAGRRPGFAEPIEPLAFGGIEHPRAVWELLISDLLGDEGPFPHLAMDRQRAGFVILGFRSMQANMVGGERQAAQQYLFCRSTRRCGNESASGCWPKTAAASYTQVIPAVCRPGGGRALLFQPPEIVSADAKLRDGPAIQSGSCVRGFQPAADVQTRGAQPHGGIRRHVH